MEERKYALPIPRAIATGIIFEAAEKFDLEVDQEKTDDDAFDIITGLPRKDYVPRIILRGDSPEQLYAAREYIYKKHEEWIERIEDSRRMRSEHNIQKIRE